MALSTASVQAVSWRFSGPFMIEWYSGDHTVNRRLSNEIRNRAGSLTVCELNGCGGHSKARRGASGQRDA
jgi:hypothetical protein